MALTDNPFIGMPLVEQQQLYQLATQALANILKTGKAYAFPGLSRNNMDAADVRLMMSQLRISMAYTSGQVKQSAQVIINTQCQFDP